MYAFRHNSPHGTDEFSFGRSIEADEDIGAQFPDGMRATIVNRGLSFDPESRDLFPAVALSWVLVGLMGVATLVAVMATGLSTSAPSAPLWLLALTGALASYHFRLRPISKLLGCVNGSLQIFVIAPLGILLSFAAAGSGAPFQDALLLAGDRAIGFDWTAYAHFVDQRPWLSLTFRLAYLSFLLQPLPLIILLAFAGQLRRLHLFTAAYSLCLLVTCLVFVFVPAVSVYAHLGIDAAAFANISSVSTVEHVALIEQMRAGTLGWVDPLSHTGLVTFPSFHACAAVLLAWGFWGVRPLRLPGVLLNITMIAATPIQGAHYFVDIIAGVLLAFGGIAAVKALEVRAAHPLMCKLGAFSRRSVQTLDASLQCGGEDAAATVEQDFLIAASPAESA